VRVGSPPRFAVWRLVPKAVTYSAARLLLACLVACSSAGCGKKGPPLPPLLKIPVAPGDFTVERRGADVRIQLTIPSTNTDGSKPANVERVEIYRFTGASDPSDDQLLRFGTRVATVPVKAPRNPDMTTEPDEPEEEPDLKDEGLDQGSIAQLEDELGPTAFQPVDLQRERRSNSNSFVTGPLVGPGGLVQSAIYAAVGFNTRGRKGPLSKRMAVPLVSPPHMPSPPTITYDETAIHVAWTPEAGTAPVQEPATGDMLPSRVIGFPAPSIAYHLYDASPTTTAGSNTQTSPLAGQLRLTQSPVAEPRYDDSRIEWGATRCYTVRTVETSGGLSLESDAPPPQCTTLVDTFPPSAPKDLQLVAGERSINLIWATNGEKDLAGYVVLRGVSPGEELERITPVPVSEATFADSVQSGLRYIYAVQAIDKAGNVSPLSNRAEETAR
jgi:predicted small lipoprotein YifL